MKDSETGQTRQQHLGIVVNSAMNFIMLLIVAIYFVWVYATSKFRFNWQSRIRMLLIMIAFSLRAFLSFYDCFMSFETIVGQQWRFYVIYYIDVVFMMIYLTAIFRVIGSLSLIKEIKNQKQTSIKEMFQIDQHDEMK